MLDLFATQPLSRLVSHCLKIRRASAQYSVDFSSHYTITTPTFLEA